MNYKEDRFAQYMGDELEWAGLVEEFWLHALTNDRRKSIEVSKHKATQVWTGLLHLMYLGLGWQNPGLGLEKWRKEGYRSGLHPVLDFVYNTAGENLIALEVFLKNASLRMRGAEGPHAQFLSNFDVESGKTWADKAIQKAQLSNLGEEILPIGGWDPLHLSIHLENSFRKSDSSSEVGFRTNNYATLVIDKYAGWHHHLETLNRELQIRGLPPTEVQVGVKIIGMNKLGDFKFSEESGLWYLS